MEFNELQKQAIAEAKEWYLYDWENKKLHYTLAGYAGTGKTTVAKGILDAIDVPNNEVLLISYTCKAAKVLQSKTGIDAYTIHRSIYKSPADKELEALKKELSQLRLEEKSETRDAKVTVISEKIDNCSSKYKPKLKSKSELERFKDAQIIVADECSMIDEHILNDLLSFNIKILFIGDPGQLPPIDRSKKSLNDLIQPNITLETIMRQDNAIPLIAQKVRNKEHISYHSDNGFTKSYMKTFDRTALIRADQVICHKNITRMKLNQEIRKLRGFKSVFPLAGETVICKKNNYYFDIINGQTYTLKNDAKDIGKDKLQLDIVGLELPIIASKNHFLAYFNTDLAEDIRKRQDYNKHTPFDFGYAITVHNAQGSEWDKVIVYNDNNRKSEEDYSRWLYTAITRAKTNCWLVE
jgi:exodeoxyribonuclease-5